MAYMAPARTFEADLRTGTSLQRFGEHFFFPVINAATISLSDIIVSLEISDHLVLLDGTSIKEDEVCYLEPINVSMHRAAFAGDTQGILRIIVKLSVARVGS